MGGAYKCLSAKNLNNAACPDILSDLGQMLGYFYALAL